VAVVLAAGNPLGGPAGSSLGADLVGILLDKLVAGIEDRHIVVEEDRWRSSLG